jgi:uncharacterized membrane protein YkvA (DUF1232 family)
MLYKLIDQVCNQIMQLNPKVEVPLMLRQIDQARPDLRTQLSKTTDNPETKDILMQAIAAGALNCIKGTPEVAQFLTSKLNDGRVPPQIKCALGAVLAYLVQPHDLVPDDAPGGYGFLDDSAILRVGLIEYLKLDPVSQFDMAEQEKFANMVFSVLPPSVIPTLQLAVGSMATTFQIMSMLPGEVALLTLQQIIANPLQAAAPAAPQGFTPEPVPSYGGGHWSGGAYFEGGNVVVPGGPSLIDGQLFIPN